jgi:hypothetical protein
MTQNAEQKAATPRITTQTSIKSLLPAPSLYTINVPNGSPVSIRFQEGPIDPKKGENGIFMEDLIEVMIMRLIAFQRHNATACLNNEMALQFLTAAKHELTARTAARKEAGVVGTLGKHE